MTTIEIMALMGVAGFIVWVLARLGAIPKSLDIMGFVFFLMGLISTILLLIFSTFGVT